MVLIGTIKPKLINLDQVVSLNITRNKVSVHVKGTTGVNQEIVIEDFNVKESWSVVLKTTDGTLEYINCASRTEALNKLESLLIKMRGREVAKTLRAELENKYVEEKIEE